MRVFLIDVVSHFSAVPASGAQHAAALRAAFLRQEKPRFPDFGGVEQ